MSRLLFLFSTMLLSFSSFAVEQTTTAKTLQTSPLSAMNLLQTVFGLVLVLVCIVLVAWLLKRSNSFHTTANGKLKVLAGLPLGPRERIVVVQVGDEQLLLGITPQQISKLHNLAEPLFSNQPTTEPSDFASKLKQMMQERGQK